MLSVHLANAARLQTHHSTSVSDQVAKPTSTAEQNDAVMTFASQNLALAKCVSNILIASQAFALHCFVVPARKD